MKKFILLVMLFMSSTTLFAQSYPRIEVDSYGNKVVVMTITQAQKIDNNLDILKLLKLQGYECDSLNISYIKLVDELDKQKKLTDSIKMKLEDNIESKDDQIFNLEERLANSISSDSACVKQKDLKNQEIILLKKEIRNQKIQKIVGFTTGAAAIVVSFILLLKSL